MSIDKYIGRTVVIVYEDRKGQLTQRTILIRQVAAGTILAYDIARQQPRRFRTERVLAFQPVAGHAS
ncbi:hypothetical protein [Cohnella fermenti]|uniref:WYL domain-containing protein n=1 Tax=Cohnella fermenti TaxID=2565925 RepID=A0A4S4BG48_9BACL|nr:hypothetical protein [Cohnella fermenti]THF73257.1 hypothetical protein E6C55_29980 [Cohnella fermenti]